MSKVTTVLVLSLLVCPNSAPASSRTPVMQTRPDSPSVSAPAPSQDSPTQTPSEGKLNSNVTGETSPSFGHPPKTNESPPVREIKPGPKPSLLTLFRFVVTYILPAQLLLLGALLILMLLMQFRLTRVVMRPEPPLDAERTKEQRLLDSLTRLDQTLRNIIRDSTDSLTRLDQTLRNIIRDSTDSLTRELTQVQNSLEQVTEILRSVPESTAAALDRCLSERDAARQQAEKDAFLQDMERAINDTAQPTTPLLEIARLTARIVNALAHTEVGQELKGTFASYLEVAHLADQLEEKLTHRAELDAYPSWETARLSLLRQLQLLGDKLATLSRGHRPAAFCQLLDEANTPELRTLRLNLMNTMGIAEITAKPGDLVADLSNYEVTRVIGEGTKLKIAEAVAPGYKLTTTGDVLRKPRVVINQSS